MNESGWQSICPGDTARSGLMPPLWNSETRELQQCWRQLLYLLCYAVYFIPVMYNVGVIFGLRFGDARAVSTVANRRWHVFLISRVLLNLAFVVTFTTEMALMLTKAPLEKVGADWLLALQLAFAVLSYLSAAVVDVCAINCNRRVVLITLGYTSQILLWLPIYTLHVLDFRGAIVGAFAPWMKACVYVIFALQTALFLSNAALLLIKYGVIKLAASSSATTYSAIDEDTSDDFTQTLIAPGVSTQGVGTAHDGLGRGVLSLLFFLWVNPLIDMGSRQPIKTYEKLFELPEDLHASREIEALVKPLDSTASRKSRIYLLTALWSVYGWRWLTLGIVKLLFTFLNYVPPLMLSGLVSFLEILNSNDDHRKRDLNYYAGTYYAAGIVLASFAAGFISVHYRFRISRLSINVRGAIMDLVYGKLMRIRSCDLSANLESSQLMNLVGTDCERVAESIMYIHQLWALPFQIGIALYLLYLQVGLAFLGGVVFAVLLLPVNQFLASRITKLFDSQMKQKDARVKLLSECLVSMRVIKLQAWEPHFEKLLNQIRALEMKSWSGIKYLDAFCVYFWATTPVLMSVITFSIFVLTGNTLTAAKTFTTITIFHLLLVPLNVVPWILTGASEAWVSIKRLQTFFALVDIDLDAYYQTNVAHSSSSASSSKRALLSIDNMSFQWPYAHNNSNPTSMPTDESARDEPEALMESNRIAIPLPSNKAAPASSPSSPTSLEQEPLSLSSSPYANSFIERARLAANEPSSSVLRDSGGDAASLINNNNGSINSASASAVAISSRMPFAAKTPSLAVGVRNTPTLRHISLNIREGELIGVVGRVGSGKSSLLMALVAEMHQHRASLESSYAQEQHTFTIDRHVLKNGFSLALQDNWIQQGTVKENITFRCKAGAKSQTQAIATTATVADAEHYYETIIDACALRYDVVQALPHGDATEIGEHGVTLSGGQRARIALARACFANKSIVLLDDPLSAVDANVAEHIFNHCIRGLLKHKTVVLVTHHVDFLRDADHVIVMRHGRISKAGPPAQVLDFARDDMMQSTPPVAAPNVAANTTPDENDADDAKNKPAEAQHFQNVSPLVDDEEREYGVVRASIWKEYCRSAGWVVSFFVVFTILLQEVSYVSTDFWLAHWTSVSEHSSDTPVRAQPRDVVWYYLRFYIALAVVNSVCSVFRAFIFAYAGLRAARQVHDMLLKTLLYATQHFYDSTPSGRVVNRYGSDIGTIDDQLPFLVNILLAQIFEIVGTFTIICIGLPWFTLLVLPAVPLYIWIQRLYRQTSREVKRIFTLTRSPIYSWFTESISGLAHIRAMRMQDRFYAQFRVMLAANQRAKYAEVAAGEWLNLRLQMFGAIVVSLVVIMALVVRADAAIVGLTLSYALAIVSLLGAIVSTFVGTEQYMVSVERVIQYVTGVPCETNEGEIKPSASWPENGEIVFDNVKLRYRPDLPLALNGISLTIRPNEKLAFVGRTGAGKSSILQALFRTVELADEGRIWIDNIDISQLGLSDLRSRLAIIPQNPNLFDTTLSGNIDPLHKYDSEVIARSIRQCLLEDCVNKLGGWSAVDTVKLGEAGSRLSVGERQLVCLARALVTKSKVLCLDEATASVDLETDKRIQRVLRKAFKNSTVICIAHRIQTIHDYDRVAVVDNGRIVECDTPATLLSNSDSRFYKLAQAASLRNNYSTPGGSRLDTPELTLLGSGSSHSS